MIKNQKRIEELLTELLGYMDPNPSREGLKETPHRVWKYYNEILEAQWMTNDEIAADPRFNKCFDANRNDSLVVEKDIAISSMCEHHLAPMYDMKVAVGYIPRGKVIGLSKIARVAEFCGKRLQLQEKIGADIADVMSKILNTHDVVVVIEGKHSCMTSRGVKARESITRTAYLSGAFRDNFQLREEFYNLIK